MTILITVLVEEEFEKTRTTVEAGPSDDDSKTSNDQEWLFTLPPNEKPVSQTIKDLHQHHDLFDSIIRAAQVVRDNLVVTPLIHSKEMS